MSFVLVAGLTTFSSPTVLTPGLRPDLAQSGVSNPNRVESDRPPTPMASPVLSRAASEWWRNKTIQKRLDLRSDQIADIERSWKQHVSASRQVAESLTQKWQAIDLAVAEQKITPDELRHMLMVAESLRVDVNTSRVVTLYKIFLILDTVQRNALREWLATERLDPSRGRRPN